MADATPLPMNEQRGLPRIAKVFLDRSVAALMTLLLSPLMLVISALILLFMGPPILFRQRRPGYRGRVFELFKFRTMNERRSEDGVLLPDDVRMTSLGRILRSTSLDELPQLINVLRGELSF